MFAFLKFTEHAAYAEWLERQYRPVMGADGEDDVDHEAAVRTEHADWDDEQVTAEVEKRKTEAAAAAAAGDDDDDDEGDDDPVKKLEAELAKKNTELTAAQAAIRKARQEAREARTKVAAESGNWEQLATERETEIADLKEQLVTKTEEAATATTDLDKFRREVRVTRIAQRLGYHDPVDAMSLLQKQEESENKDLTNDDKTAERALRALAESKKYLVDVRRATGRQMNGTGGGGTLTQEQISAMSPEELNSRWPEVSAAMAASRAGGG